MFSSIWPLLTELQLNFSGVISSKKGKETAGGKVNANLSLCKLPKEQLKCVLDRKARESSRQEGRKRGG